MRGKAPERVLLTANLAQVQAVGGDITELAQVALAEHGPEAHDAGMVLEQVAHHEDAPVGFGEFHEVFGMGHYDA